MTNARTLKKYSFFFVAIVALHCLSACSKKPTGIRAQVKTEADNLNPSVSAAADQQATALNADYSIYSISVPQQTSAGHIVELELRNPGGQFLPVITRHENGKLDSEGRYVDSQRGLEVWVQARCSSDNCAKYILLVTVVKNNQSVYQSLALSYKDDCKFNKVTSSGTIGTFYPSLNAAASSSQIAGIMPKNDCSE